MYGPIADEVVNLLHLGADEATIYAFLLQEAVIRDKDDAADCKTVARRIMQAARQSRRKLALPPPGV